MSDPSPLSKPKEASTFSSFLAALTNGIGTQNEPWDDSALADDVSTISYEQALRSHRRIPYREMLPVEKTRDDSESNVAKSVSLAPGKNRKTASITIRLTREEEAQLHARAAAAQLTISAYLRSCIFEAESLRAQVIEALSQLRAATPPPVPSMQTTHDTQHNWRKRLSLPWRTRRELKAES